MVVLAGQCLRSAPSGASRVMSSVISHVCWRGLHMFMCVCARMCREYVWSVCILTSLFSIWDSSHRCCLCSCIWKRWHVVISFVCCASRGIH